MVELLRHRIRVATRLSLCRDSVVCITATQSRPNNFQLRTRLVRCQDRTEIHARILAVEPLPLVSGTRRAVEDHAMQSAAFQGGASCIKDSAAFSFDERQLPEMIGLLPPSLRDWLPENHPAPFPLSGWMSNFEQLWQPDLWILMAIRDSTSGKEPPNPDLNGSQTTQGVGSSR